MGAPEECDVAGAAMIHLPVASSSFVGRIADLDALAERFENGAQLLTITGLGGMGKTRLAQRFAASQAESYTMPGAGGVWFCDLTGVDSASSACAAIASVLGIQLGADEPPLSDHLGRALARRGRILIVLDNFEQLTASADATLSRWMRASRARFLVTSRVALGLAGEHLWPLRPLQLPPAEVDDTATLAAVESIELFIRRARQLRPRLVLRPEDLRAIADIVRHVDGIPLAIELAAARITVLSLAQLRDRMAHRLALLVRHNDRGRHSSMRHALADSWEQLRPAERDCLAGCTIFSGGFSLAAAEAVLGAHVGSVLAEIESLCLRSLVRSTPLVELRGELRFSLYETIREFAAEHLAAVPRLASRLEAQHAAYYADLGRTLALPAATAGGSAAIRLDLELDNLTSALKNALRDPQGASRALMLACATHRALIRRGLARRALDLLNDALARARPTASPAHLAPALLARGQTHRMLGALHDARVDIEEGLTLAAGDPTTEARGHTLLGELVELSGATQAARDLFMTALSRLAAALDDPRRPLLEADVRTRLAHTYRREGDLENAEREIHRALVLHRAVERSDELPLVLYEAAAIAWFRGRHDESLARIDEGLALVQATDARYARGPLLYVRAALLQDQGSLDEAFDHYVRAIEFIRAGGNLYLEASALYYFAGAHLERGQHEDAAKLLERAMLMFIDLGIPRYQALIESCRATLFAVAGDLEAAHRCLEAADHACAECRSERALAATVAIHRLYIRMTSVCADERTELLAEARALVESDPSDDSRFALRAALSCLARADLDRHREALVVQPGARLLRLPGSTAELDLRRRGPLQRIVLALAHKRVEAPGEALALEDLLAAGWPGERLGDSAGANRVHVALTTLRKLGLRPFLISSRGGYALTTAVACVLKSDQ